MNTNQQLYISCDSDIKEILMAELAMLGFDSFQETEIGFLSHSAKKIDNGDIDEILNRYQGKHQITREVRDIVKENWNKIWEESYDPIIVENKCIVRASFHEPQTEYPIEIIVNPKMSFGTGHHETTYLMMSEQFKTDHKGKKVLDAGCGTGILSILAGKLGAEKIMAYDIDDSIIDNIQENLKINGIDAKVLIGIAQTLSFNTQFDIILANINKNILLSDLPFYAKWLGDGGQLIMSGFYETDIKDIKEIALKNGLILTNSRLKNDWAMVKFTKD